MKGQNFTGKIVAVLAKDHSSSMGLSKEDLDRIRNGTATLIAIGLVMEETDEKMFISSFFTDFQGDFTHHDIHSILKDEVIKVEVLKDIPGVTG